MAASKPIDSGTKRTERPLIGGNGLTLGNLFSIQVRLHVSVIIVGSLIVAGLARGVLPNWHPEWTNLPIWSAAIVAGILFFVSLVAHEFAHALVARRFGIRTEHITLFLFGALAAIEREPETPKQELLIAAAGPAMSLSLALLFGGIVMLSDPSFFAPSTATAGLETALSNLSYFGTIAFWLASINTMLGLFNLIPGFPMDGGRILRALLWWRSSDLASSTHTAARGGIIFGWLLVIYGAYLVLNNQLIDGLWAAAIGYFISQLARNSAQQFLRNQALHQTTVADIMRTRFERVSGTLPLDIFVDDYLLRSTQQIWPVTKDGTDVGYISLGDIPLTTERGSHGYRHVEDCMHPLQRIEGLDPKTSGVDALRLLADQRLPMPVVVGSDAPSIVGLIHQKDVLRWIARHPNLLGFFDLQDQTSS